MKEVPLYSSVEFVQFDDAGKVVTPPNFKPVFWVPAAAIQYAGVLTAVLLAQEVPLYSSVQDKTASPPLL